MKNITYLSEITKALQCYGGVASLSEIIHHITTENILPNIHTNNKWTNNVSTVIQRHCAETKSYNGGTKLFYSVFGIGHGVYGLLSHRDSIQKLATNPFDQRAITNIEQDTTLDATTKTAVILARKGQGAFRKCLLAKYSACIVTGIQNEQLLVASHIKPWRVSNNDERLDANNGLLLSCLYDKLFDRGLISFDNNGHITPSHCLSAEDKARMGIVTDRQFINMNNNPLSIYMEYHRDVIFEKSTD